MNNKYHTKKQRPIELLLRQPYYDMVKSGRKTIEGRVAYRWLDRIEVGSKLDFKRGPHHHDALHCLVNWVLRADNFEEGLIEVEWQKAVPNAKNFDHALAIYERIYPTQRVQEIGGIILIGFAQERERK